MSLWTARSSQGRTVTQVYPPIFYKMCIQGVPFYVDVGHIRHSQPYKYCILIGPSQIITEIHWCAHHPGTLLFNLKLERHVY